MPRRFRFLPALLCALSAVLLGLMPAKAQASSNKWTPVGNGILSPGTGSRLPTTSQAPTAWGRSWSTASIRRTS